MIETCNRWLTAPPEQCAKVRGHRGPCLRRSALERAIRESRRERVPGDLAAEMVEEARRTPPDF